MTTRTKGQLLAWVELACSRPELVQDPQFATLIGETLRMLGEEDEPLPIETTIEDHPNVIPLSRRRG